MKKIGIFYGSTMGETKDVAEMIVKEIGEDKVELFNVASVSGEEVKKYDNLILGSSTWGFGELQDDWNAFIEDIKNIDFTGKKVALFGLGDQIVYPDTFADAIGIIYQVVKDNGAEVIGQVSTDGYDFDDSTALNNKQFVGLPLDNNNQADKTGERIDSWVKDILEKF